MDMVPDPNNNSPGEKSYSLRPRAALKKDEEDTDQEESWRPRGRSKKRSKQKCLPLSKYRRKTANARERSRMREINEAFEALRRALPHFNSRNENPNEKTTKIMTLRLAMKYITALDSALRQADMDSDGESLISDYSMTPPTSREHSLTPSSLSEHSDIFDQLFITSTFEDYSPAASSSCAISPFLSESIRSPSRVNLPLSSKTETSHPFFKSSLGPSNSHSSKLSSLSHFTTSSSSSRPSMKPPHLPPYPSTTTSISAVADHQPSPIESVKDSLSPVDLHEYSTTPWKDFDCLPSSPINLDDLFIT
ncbi:hypothetical protein J6590_008703 [Homalodisca vitripennis]|nr:hypothetical protein J6590_008703 [Homalodisca vitripennis]